MIFVSRIGFCATLLLGACAGLPSDSKSIQGSRISLTPPSDSSGIGPIENQYENTALKVVDLMAILDPANYSGWAEINEDEDAPQTRCNTANDHDGLTDSERLSCAFYGFHSVRYEDDEELVAGAEAPEFRRNEVQDRIIMASNQACGEYKQHLLASQSGTNFAYGNATTLTAALAAIFTPPDTTRALAGTSAFLSGSRAEYNNNYFRKLLAEVITRGISEERDTLIESIQKRRSFDLDKYTVQNAVADAIVYDAKCSLIAGLENAQKSQSFYSELGIKRLAFLLTGSDDPAKVPQLFTAIAVATEEEKDTDTPDTPPAPPAPIGDAAGDAAAPLDGGPDVSPADAAAATLSQILALGDGATIDGIDRAKLLELKNQIAELQKDKQDDADFYLRGLNN